MKDTMLRYHPLRPSAVLRALPRNRDKFCDIKNGYIAELAEPVPTLRETTRSFAERTLKLFALLLLLFIGITPAQAHFTGGDGRGDIAFTDAPLFTPPVFVSSWEDLHNMRDDLSGGYLLTQNLGPNDPGYDTYAGPTANSGAGWLPINNFTGILDGGGFIIEGLTINRTTNHAGFLGDASTGSPKVENIGFTNASIITTGDNAGVIFGTIDGAEAVMENLFVSGSVQAASNAGGLAGSVAGYSSANPLLAENVYNLASVTATTANAGGLIGHITQGAGNLNVLNSFSAERVTTPTGGGGTTGVISGTLTTNFTGSYWDTQRSTQTSTAGNHGTGLTTAQMQGANASTNMTDFDFSDTWATMENGVAVDGFTPFADGYPVLRNLDIPTQFLAGFDPMVLVFDTQLSGHTNAQARQVTLPLRGTVNALVDWGDGNTQLIDTAGEHSHVYASDGVYTVRVFGEVTVFGRNDFQFIPTLNVHRLKRVLSFGDLGIESLGSAFQSADNLIEIPDFLPPTVTNINSLFNNNISFNNPAVVNWDVSNVTQMNATFRQTRFNQDISAWNVSSVTNMQSMFNDIHSFNQDIGGWDVSNVTRMGSMFADARSFDQDISNWNTSNVTDMSFMFQNAAAFNQDISTREVTVDGVTYTAWDVSSVTNMRQMFGLASQFNQAIGNWDVSNVSNMLGMFQNATSFNQDIGDWDVSNVTNMSRMFEGVTLSPQNYSSLLTDWSQRTLRNNVSFHGGNSRYFLGEPATARQSIIDTYNWTITDGGPVPPDQTIWFAPETAILNQPFAAAAEFRLEDNLYPFSGEINLDLATGSGTLSGGTTGSASNGIVVFQDLKLDAFDDYTLQASIGNPVLYTSDASEAIAITSNYTGGDGRGDDEDLAASQGFIPFFVWQGGESGSERDWFTFANWSGAENLITESPDGSAEQIITIPGVNDAADQPLVASADPQPDLDIRGTLILEEEATLTVEEGPLLRISDGATVTTEGSGADAGRIILESGARYVNLSNQTPLLQAERQLTGSRGWRMISSPVDTDYADFTNEIQTQGFPNADLAEANPGNPENFTPNFMWWDETDAGTTLKGWRTVNYDGSGDPAEDLVNIPVLAGRGHFYFNFDGAGRPDDNGNYDDALPLTMLATGVEPNLSVMTGEAFTFNPLTFTERDNENQNEGTGAGEDGNYIDRIEADQGWNLLGNPTASALDWKAASGWTKTNISETIYVWDPSTNDYLVSNGINGNLPDNRIAPWQAFWVQATAASPALSFTNDVKTIEPYLFIGGEHAENGMAKSAAKTADGDAAQASLNSQEAGPQTIALTLTGAGMTASNWLMFSDNGRNGLDRYDAFRLEPLSDTWISAATSMEPGGPSLVINSLPEHATGLMSLPYYVGAARDGVPYNGSFELKWTISEEWADGRHITLMDHQQERAIDMLAESSYSFGHITEPEVAPAAMISQSDSDQRANGNHNLGKSMTGDSTLSKKEISTISTTDRPEIVHGLPRLPGNIAFRGQGSFGSDGSAEYGERQPSTGSNSGSQTWNDLRNGTVISESMSDAATAASTVAQTGERPRFSIVISAEASQDYISDEPMLKASYPNPFNSSTTIPFTLPSEQRVTIEVFDILGRRVSTLVNSELSAGVHEVRWNVRNSASGVYIIRMVSREGVQSSRITLVK